MGSLLVGDVSTINESNFLNLVPSKNENLINGIKKENKTGSLFFYLDKNNDGVLNEEEFLCFEKMSNEKICNLVSIDKIEKPKKLLNKEDLSSMCLKLQIKEKEDKIKELKAKKKNWGLKHIFGSLGVGALGFAAKVLFGTSLLFSGGISCTALLLLAANFYLHNKKIDAKIAELNAEIKLLKNALILTV